MGAIFVTLAVLALLPQALCTQGDMCYVAGAKTALVDNQLFFMGGNYSMVTYNGQIITPTASLYSLNLSSDFPVERSIPQALLTNDTIASSITVAYGSVTGPDLSTASGALWQTNDTLYVFGGGFDTPNNMLSSYNVQTGEWTDVNVAGGDFNFGNRSNAQYVSVPDSGLGFVYGGTSPYMPGMIRFNASDPNNLSWTNETLGNGSRGVEVPNLESGAMVYIPAGKEGMLVTFGGGNATAGIYPPWGWPYDADWLTIYVYDIASHTWWAQQASGDAPTHLGGSCTAVTMSPDGSAFHITVYGGWSLNFGRAYEDVRILSIPSFTWIDATSLSDESNKEEQVNSTIGRDNMLGACQTYNGAQMIVLGGEIRAGAYSLTNGACSDVFEPVRVLDLSTYEWQTQLNTNVTYQVPEIIYDQIGGNATGSATSTVPSAGFADPTLSSLLQLRVATATSTSSTSSSSTSSPSALSQQQNSSSTHTGAIAGGVVGGVAGVAIILGFILFLLRRRGSNQAETPSNPPEYFQQGLTKESPPQEMAVPTYSYELAGNHRPAHELPGGETAVGLR